MVHEIISIGVGQAGVQLGLEIWRQYNAEHSIALDGTEMASSAGASSTESGFRHFYEETEEKIFKPRNLFIDTDPDTISDIEGSDMAALFKLEDQVSGREDAGNVFARGHNALAFELSDRFMDQIRQLVENCDHFQGFILSHAVGGGTGSGLTCRLSERLAVDYRKKGKHGYQIYPSASLSKCVIEPYNALLSTHFLLDHCDVSLYLDNEAIYELAQRKLGMKHPSYGSMNRIISKVVSSVTSDMRFGGSLFDSLGSFQTELVPFPRIHSLISSLAPLRSKKSAVDSSSPMSTQSMTLNCMDPDSFLVKFNFFDPKDEKYAMIGLIYRGADILSREINACVQLMRRKEIVTFLDWSTCSFRIAYNDNNTPVAAAIESDEMMEMDKNVTMIANNCSIIRPMSDCFIKKYDKMFANRAYLHWYLGNDMEESEFVEAREEIAYLQKDYCDCCQTEGWTSDEDDYDDES